MSIDGRDWRFILLRLRLSIDGITHLLSPISIEGFDNLLSPTISIDRLPPSSIVEEIDHCCVYCPGCDFKEINSNRKNSKNINQKKVNRGPRVRSSVVWYGQGTRALDSLLQRDHSVFAAMQRLQFGTQTVRHRGTGIADQGVRPYAWRSIDDSKRSINARNRSAEADTTVSTFPPSWKSLTALVDIIAYCSNRLLKKNALNNVIMCFNNI